MSFKESIMIGFKTEKDIVNHRYKSSSLLLVFSIFLFFLNYFFIGARFYTDFFIKILPFTYILMLVCFLFYSYFFLRKLLLGKGFVINLVIFILLFIVYSLFSLVFIFGEDLKNYISF